MTEPVILLGTQSNGETLPVQVDAFGRLVAEGLQGPEGPEGPPGPEGPSGISLPPDPFEGALLGWEDNQLAWIGERPIPLPANMYGPITAWDPSGLLTLEGKVPSASAGDTFYQCDLDGNSYREDMDQRKNWSSFGEGYTAYPGRPLSLAFTENSEQCAMGLAPFNLSIGPITCQTIEVWAGSGGDQSQCVRVSLNGGQTKTACGIGRNENKSHSFSWILSDFELRTINISADGDYNNILNQINIDGRQLINPTTLPGDPSLSFRVNQVIDNTLIGNPNPSGIPFTPGKYLIYPTARIPAGTQGELVMTTDIDLLRST